MTLCPCVTAFLDAQYKNAKCCAVARCAHADFTYPHQYSFIPLYSNHRDLLIRQ